VSGDEATSLLEPIEASLSLSVRLPPWISKYYGHVWFVANYATLCLRLVVRIEELGPVWFTTSVTTLCLTFLPKVSYSIRTTNLRQSVAHLVTNQTGP
jgi:hypothetical protein